MFGNKKRKQPAVTAVQAAPAAVAADEDDGPLDPAWLVEQERAAAAAERQREQSPDDDNFATAVCLVQVDAALREPNGASPTRRVERIVAHGAASGLTGGQLAALERLMARVEEARDLLGAAERRRATGRPQVHVTGGRSF